MSDLMPPLPDMSHLLSNSAKPDPQAKAQETGKQFESVFLTQFVDQMLKTVGPTAFGGEKQAEMWRSFLSEAIAGSLVEQGGLGLGQNVTQAIDAYQQGAARKG